MSFLPTKCGSCRRVALLSLSHGTEGSFTCQSCGAPASVVPGCTFGSADLEPFREASEVIAEGRITQVEALSLSIRIERVLWSGGHQELLEGLCERLPGLLPMQIAARSNPIAQKRALTMLKVIFDAVGQAQPAPVSSPAE